MGKKRKALTTSKYDSKRSAWLQAVQQTETLTEQTEEVIKLVEKTAKVVADKTSTIELVEPPKPVHKKSYKPIKIAKRTTTKSTHGNTSKTKTAKKTTKE